MNIEEADPYAALAIGRPAHQARPGQRHRPRRPGRRPLRLAPLLRRPGDDRLPAARSASSRSPRRTRPSPPPRRSGGRWPRRRTVSPRTACAISGRSSDDRPDPPPPRRSRPSATPTPISRQEHRPVSSSLPALRRLLAGAAATAVTAVVAVTASASPALAATTTLYASPSGTGTDCSARQPCSLTAAQTAVRSLNDAMSGRHRGAVGRRRVPAVATVAADRGRLRHQRPHGRLAGRPVGASGDHRRPGGHRLVAGRRRQEHLAGQRRPPGSTPGSSTSTAPSPPGRARR